MPLCSLTSSTLIAQVREAPQVAYPDRVAHTGQNESCLRAPVIPGTLERRPRLGERVGVPAAGDGGDFVRSGCGAARVGRPETEEKRVLNSTNQLRSIHQFKFSFFTQINIV